MDLVLIKDALYPTAADLADVRAAAVDVFESRALVAEAAGVEKRTWPPTIVTNELWESEWFAPAIDGGVDRSLAEAIEVLNGWIAAIDRFET
ncbi:hypothetical protein ET445_07030 [Agromyces protaetiae]|uniref:Uncharacterized protein n=1 Tax=Agromyces protaetiae TaxID=2509455 RepID=A0A4P6FBX9_9MICO|nr:hypothetical protein [Agromyces protaetiae]QAY73136.1 hypothetical protein ET445_07030 [Agromyces protaetiae]